MALARAGCRLALADLDRAGLEATRDQILAAPIPPPVLTLHTLDVGDRASLAAWAAEVARAHGGTHLLINNAGITVIGAFEALTPDEIERVLEVDLLGPIRACHAFLPQLRAAPEARIVNVSSLFGLIGAPFSAPYCAAKFGLSGFGEALRCELRGTSIGLTTVYPGALRTPLVHNAPFRGPGSEARRERLLPLFAQRGTLPEEAARQIVRAVRRGRGRVVVGGLARWLDRLHRLSPSLFDRLRSRFADET